MSKDSKSLRIVLADDHPVMRDGLRGLLNAEPDMRVVGEASDGEAAYRLTGDLTPDVLVIDLSMPVMGGVQATEIVKGKCPNVKVLALTVHEESLYVRQLLRAGASGYVLKRAAAAELVRAIRVVAGGGTYIDPAVAGQLVDGYLQRKGKEEHTRAEHLSDRERDVLMRIAKGYSNKEIAAELGLSIKTVETYKARMSEKLRLKSRVDIVRYAAQRGWLD